MPAAVSRPPPWAHAQSRLDGAVFLDEAVALAAGHRPCHFCRHADAMRFKAAWADANGPTTAPEMDRILHPARVTRQRQQVR
ncbi:MAG: hypothetical protein VX201_07380, partial [Pseudomonadota bacterium]|nr:hypothetical protein [Pseudomonadota bacterium]